MFTLDNDMRVHDSTFHNVPYLSVFSSPQSFSRVPDSSPRYGLDDNMRLPFSVVHIDYCLASDVLDTSCVGSSVIDCALLSALRNPSAGVPSIEAKVIFQPSTENIPELDSRRPWSRNGR